jgi:hypothetical protein
MGPGRSRQNHHGVNSNYALAAAKAGNVTQAAANPTAAATRTRHTLSVEGDRDRGRGVRRVEFAVRNDRRTELDLATFVRTQESPSLRF